MSFRVIYYISLACPTVDRSMDMVEKYIAGGADSFQIDMPSHDPYGETDFIKKCMADALAAHPSYDYYMDAFRQLRKRYPDIQLSIVVYKDVIDEIGIERFTDFCNELGMYSVRLAGNDDRDAYTAYMRSHGLYTVEGIGYYMPQDHIDRVKGLNNIVTLRTRRKTEAPNRGFETWKQRIDYIRCQGVTAPIFAIADMKSAADLEAAKEGGADGVIVGNVLMRLWEDEAAFKAKLAELQACAVK